MEGLKTEESGYKPKYQNLRDAYEEFKALKENGTRNSREERHRRRSNANYQGQTERRYINI